MNNVIDFINVNRDKYLDELKALLAIPSISALPEHAADVKRCADWCADEMRRIGMQNVRLIDTPGYPVVYGDWLGAPGAPTILFYGHYDVQPVDPLDAVEDAAVRADDPRRRASTPAASVDDKGQVFIHVKAIEAHLKQNGKLPVNMKLIVEGEEEVGSANLDNFIAANNDTSSSADVVVDLGHGDVRPRHPVDLLRPARPRLPPDRRCAAATAICTPASFGGAVANPAFVLAQMIAQMKDDDGHIKIPGFYDDVLPLTPRSAKHGRQLPFNEKQYRKEFGSPKLSGENGLHHARAHVGAADARSATASAVRLHGRRREDGAAGRGDGEDQHAPRAESGSRTRSRTVRGLRAEGRAEDRRARRSRACTAASRG